MNVFQELFLLLLLCNNILARDTQISESCLKGTEDAAKCCALVSKEEYVNLKYPPDCHVFYRCENRVPVLKRCPHILQWSVSENRCKWPATVVCDTESTLELSNGYGGPTLAGPVPPGCSTGEVSAAECCLQNPEWSNLHLPHETDCALFYQCEHSKPTLKYCPTGLHFNPQLQICDWPDQAGCVSNINGSTPVPTSTKRTTTEGNLISTTREADTTITETLTTEKISSTRTSNIPSITQELISTKTSTVEDTTTGNSQLTSDKITTSEFTTEQITSSEIPQTTLRSTTNAQTNDDTTTSNTSYTTDEITTKTSIRENITSTLTTSTTSSPPEESCDLISVSKECLSGQVPAKICCMSIKNWQKVHLSIPTNCDMYFDCINGDAILRKCPEGLHWSTISDRCEHPQDSECINITTTTHKPGTSTKHHHHHDDDDDDDNSSNSSSEISNECLYGRADPVKCCRGIASWRKVLLQNNKNCQSYYQCVQGRPMYRPCPRERWWNANKEKCDKREHATCTHDYNNHY